MQRPIVSLDESGNSGVNLLDPNQPVFTLGSVSLDDGACALLIGRSDEEIHFTETRSKPEGQQLLLEIVRGVDTQHGRVVAIHKSFMITAKIIDHLVENVLHGYGIDVFHDGSILRLVNGWHYLFAGRYGPEYLPHLQRLFVQCARKRDRDAADEFYRVVEELLARNDGPPMPGLELVTESHPFMEHILDGEFPISTLEPGWPAATGLMYEWANIFPRGLDIHHDDRQEVRSWIQYMSPLFDQSKPATTLHFPNGSVTLPLPVGQFRTVDSRYHPAVQIADVLASATSFVLRARLAGRADPFADALVDAGVLEFNSPLSVWPDVDAITRGSEAVPGQPGVVDAYTDWLG